MSIPGFANQIWEGGDTPLAYAMGGDGPPLLLLHGFPQTRAIWHAIAPALAAEFTVIAPDLRGYGASGKPDGTEFYTFRHMAGDPLALMRALGHERFHLIGHDRGGRTAHRLALDAPGAVLSLCVMDIVPTLHLLETLTDGVAAAYYHWFFLAQPHPLPESMIAADPDRYFESCLAGWGKDGLDAFDPAALAAYRTAWRNPDAIRGMCADYRAALTLDRALDEADRDTQVRCPALVLHGADGIMDKAYDVPATWAPRLANMQAGAVPGGHFFPDTHPQDTLSALWPFLRGL